MLAGASLLALSSVAVAKDLMPAHPLFAVQPVQHHDVRNAPKKGGGTLPTWDFKWTYNKNNYSAIFVGVNPSTPSSTTVPVEIIPVEVTYEKVKENPKKGGANSPLSRTIASPIFDSTTDYVQGGTDVGTTQYEDAFQRAALWGIGGNSTNYHVLLGKPKVLKMIKAAASSQGNEFGQEVLLLPLAGFDNAIQSIVKAQPVDSLPIFLMTQTYMISGGCCIGGYHSYTGVQAYSVTTYIQATGVFSQDDSALSHEVGGWHLAVHCERLHLSHAGSGSAAVFRRADHHLGERLEHVPGLLDRRLRQRRLTSATTRLVTTEPGPIGPRLFVCGHHR
jgi:hypothetical protein